MVPEWKATYYKLDCIVKPREQPKTSCGQLHFFCFFFNFSDVRLSLLAHTHVSCRFLDEVRNDNGGDECFAQVVPSRTDNVEEKNNQAKGRYCLDEQPGSTVPISAGHLVESHFTKQEKAFDQLTSLPLQPIVAETIP